MPARSKIAGGEHVVARQAGDLDALFLRVLEVTGADLLHGLGHGASLARDAAVRRSGR